jgi:hypothetical protein
MGEYEIGTVEKGDRAKRRIVSRREAKWEQELQEE